MGTAVHCLPEWQAPVWVLTGFACYSARKSRSYHAGFRKCSYTCCACYSLFPMLASAISLNGNRRQPPPCLPKSETDGRKSMAAQPFILTIDGVRPFCYKIRLPTSFCMQRLFHLGESSHAEGLHLPCLQLPHHPS